MRQASHASAPALRQDAATLSQLKELVAQMDAGKVSKAEMQEFLRHRKKKDVPAAEPSAAAVPPDELRDRVETMAQSRYAHCASEVMELFDTFCPPTLDLEFKSYPYKENIEAAVRQEYLTACGGSDREKPWILTIGSIREDVPALKEAFDRGNNFTVDKRFGAGFLAGFAEPFGLFKQLDPGFNAGCTSIAECFMERYRSRLLATHAWRYKVVSQDCVTILSEAFGNLIIIALGFISRGDPRAEQIRAYLKLQTSGTPLLAEYWNCPIFLAAPCTEQCA